MRNNKKRVQVYSSVALLSLVLVTAISGAVIFQNIPTLFDGVGAAGQSNLVISSVSTIPEKPIFGSEYDVVVKVKNAGTAAQKPLEQPVEVTVQDGLRSSVTNLKSVLQPGTEETLTFKRFQSKSVYADIDIVVDKTNKVIESSEADNKLTYKLAQMIPGETPKPTGKPTPTPVATIPPSSVTDANIVVNQTVILSRPDDKDPNNYYYIKITGSVQNNNKVALSDLQMTSTFESWFPGVTKPQLLSLKVNGLPQNPKYNGESELLLIDQSKNPILAANDNKLYGPDQVQLQFEVRVQRQTRDVQVNNLLTFQGNSKEVKKGVFNQSLIPFIIPAKTVATGDKVKTRPSKNTY